MRFLSTVPWCLLQLSNHNKTDRHDITEILLNYNPDPISIGKLRAVAKSAEVSRMSKYRTWTLFTKHPLISGPVKLTEKLTGMSAKF